MTDIETIKKEFEERFFNGRPVEYLQSTADMWNFFETKLNEIREEAVREFAQKIKDMFIDEGFLFNKPVIPPCYGTKANSKERGEQIATERFMLQLGTYLQTHLTTKENKQ